MKRRYLLWLLAVFFLLSCGNIIDIIPSTGNLPTEINEGDNPQSTQEALPTPTPAPTLTPTPTPTPTATAFFLQPVSMTPPDPCPPDCPREPPRHGLVIAFFLPVLILGIPSAIAEVLIVRHVQPHSLDLSAIRIKAQDGLFVDSVVSLTARRKLSLASLPMTWSKVRDFVEKPVEQELLHYAISYPTLEDLEKNLKNFADSFMELSLVKELKEDFGVDVVRFNIEARYPPETMEALNRRAEAAAGGTAYLAYAAAAQLDPDSREARDLYRVYQETQSRVDAARNLGGGIAMVAESFSQRNASQEGTDDGANVN